MSGARGVPMCISPDNSLLGVAEPLYVLDGNNIGNSFATITDVVNPVDVKKIKTMKGADASFYRSRGSNGIVVITTK